MLNAIAITHEFIEFTSNCTDDGCLIIYNEDNTGDVLFFQKISFKQGGKYKIDISQKLLFEYIQLQINFDNGGSYIKRIIINELLPVKFVYEDNVVIKAPRYDRLTHKFALRPHHEVGFRRIACALIKRNIIRGNIIDLGAWIGDNSMPWALIQNSLVYAIDPSDENIEFIRKIANINDCHNIVTIKEAISDSEKYITTNNDLHHAEFKEGQDCSTTLKTKSLDILMENGDIKDVGFVHLDVEGMESLVFRGSTELIKKYRPIFSYEQHLEKDDVTGLIKWLLEHNYNSYLINETLPGCRPDCRNIYAFPTERMSILDDEELNSFINVERLLSPI